MELNSFLVFVLSILALSYFYIKKKYNYWTDRGVVSAKPRFPLGNLWGVGFSKNLGELTRHLYEEFKGRGVIGGFYFFLTPNVLVTDLDLLRHVFVKDFEYFQDRGIYMNEKGDPLSANLLVLEGEKWRNMRNKLSPTFTSGRLKVMHKTFLQVADQFREHLRPFAEKSAEVEMKELFGQFTTDIIGNVAFGLQCNSMKDPDSEFRKYGRLVFKVQPIEFLKRLLVTTLPDLSRKLNISITRKDVTEFFMSTLRQTIEYRQENNVQRNDFLQLLMQIKNTGKLDGETVELGKLSFEELAAQVFIFFLAGFETSSSTMSFAAYEMALNADIQDRARKEVKEVLQRHGGVMSYEAAMELTYLEQVINETLRKYPIIPALRRRVQKPYKIPGTDIILEKNTILSIPVFGIHHDPEIYPEPEIFDPERFTKENIGKRHPYAWLPFGEGPRNCIGLRFGLMQTRVGLATLLSNFRLVPSEKTTIPLKFESSSFVMTHESCRRDVLKTRNLVIRDGKWDKNTGKLWQIIKYVVWLTSRVVSIG